MLEALSTQRLALQEESHLTPGEEDPLLSAWEKWGNEALLPVMRTKQQRRGIRRKVSHLEGSHDCSQNAIRKLGFGS